MLPRVVGLLGLAGAVWLTLVLNSQLLPPSPNSPPQGGPPPNVPPQLLSAGGAPPAVVLSGTGPAIAAAPNTAAPARALAAAAPKAVVGPAAAGSAEEQGTAEVHPGTIELWPGHSVPALVPGAPKTPNGAGAGDTSALGAAAPASGDAFGGPPAGRRSSPAA